MHVSVKEVVPKHLREEDRHARFGQLAHVGAQFTQPRDFTNLNTADALHHHHVVAAQRPMHSRHMQQRAALKVALELRGISRFAQQIQLVKNSAFVFAHHIQRSQPAAFGGPAIQQPGQCIHHFQVLTDTLAHTGPQHLDHDFAAIEQRGHMDLCDGRSRKRRYVEL